MIPATARAAQPSDWRRQWRESITDPVQLLRELGLDPLSERLAVAGAAAFPLRVPRAFVGRMRRGDPHDPLLRQVLPLDDEDRPVAGFGLDAVGDLESRQGEGILHKYAGRALLIATGSCAVNCRYCFRRHFPYAGETAARERWREALAWLADHPDVDEVILSGGDPWSLATQRLAEFTAGLRALPHVRRLRIHTRVPIVLPARVDGELQAWLRDAPVPVAVVVHANHPAEIDDEVVASMDRLRGTGAMLLNQSVLLRGVNDDETVLADLSARLFEAGVLPYYLHLLDRVAGTAHFEVPEATAVSLVGRLRERLPGYLVPRLVREIHGERAKTPVPDTGESPDDR
jgi:EF-P beta-lysylation protein EpmB